MKADTRTPAEIFGYHIRYVVPLFQRPYVWTRDDQWAPLWADVLAVADRLLTAETPVFGAPAVAPHFLGAIVVGQQAGAVGHIAIWHVVDGQQRLTTLQLLLEAARRVVAEHGMPVDAEALKVLVRNVPAITQAPHETYKVWPTDRDQAAFEAAMEATEGAETRIAQALRFFQNQVAVWALDGDDGSAGTAVRLTALVKVLREHLRIVVIDLEPTDNAQVIFETLNHRGTPLLAADLVKNLLFQLASAQQLDVQGLYDAHWKTLDSDHWRAPVPQGRRTRPRIDVFLNYWLTMKLLRDVPTDRVFPDFRDGVATKAVDVGSLVAEIAGDAAVFATLDSLPPNSPEGIFHYRVIRALDSGVVTPVLLWLMRWNEQQLPVDQRRRALKAIESWLVRRALARLTSKDTNRVLLELLKAMAEAGPSTAGDTVESFLAGQRADSRLWPDDDTLIAALTEEQLYRSILRPRLRMLLEALEDDLRADQKGEGQACPRNLTVEHVMPQAWQTHWPAPADEAERERRIHRLGNLTLVTGKLNPALSHGPWNAPAGPGKRDALLKHSTLKLNAGIVADHPAHWTEDDIDARSLRLARRVLAIWPRPEGAPSTSTTPLETEPSIDQGALADDVVSENGKYRLLWRWLSAQEAEELPMTFADVEDILQMPLPPSARSYLPPWYGYDGTALGRAIRNAGWKASQVNLTDERVLFVRANG